MHWMTNGVSDEPKGALLHRKEYFLLLRNGPGSIRESVSAKGQGDLRPSK